MPMKRSGRSVAAASRVIEIEEVLVPTMVSGLSEGHSAVKILRLTSSFSAAASITISQSARSASAFAGLMRLMAATRSSSVMRWRLTWRARLPLMTAIPSEMRAATTSLSNTFRPESAQTCAMPLPICPAPITPTLRMAWPLPPPWSPRVIGRSFASTIFAYLLRGRCGPRSTTVLFELLGQFRQGLIEVRHQPVVGDLKDRGFLILVDSNDYFRVLHTGEIEIRRHNLAGLADLPVVGRIAGVYRGARRADCRAELVGNRLYIFGEIVAALHRPAAGNNDLRRGQFRTLRLR